MLPVYGVQMPLRLLEEIVDWKTKELASAAVIRKVVPALEPPYAHLLQQWEVAFAQTLEEARSAMEEALASPGSGWGYTLAGDWENRLPRLAYDSECQSNEFALHLRLLREQSPSVQASAAANAVLEHFRRESHDFVGSLTKLERTRAVPWLVRPDPNDEDSPEHGGPEPADSPLRPEGSWTNPSDGAVVPIGGHKLPPLPYAYNALEPWIDEKTMRIHHDKHHQSYVDGLNNAERKLEEARRTGNFDLVKHWERELAFNGAGHYLHTIFWDVMSPRGGGKPTGPLADEIARSFGSYEAFKKQFSEAAAKVEGGGWAILVWSPRSRRLEILTAEKHQNLSQWDVVPLLPLDVWEHAYYLKHQNDRAGYINDWWNVVYWPAAAERFAKASQLQWAPF